MSRLQRVRQEVDRQSYDGEERINADHSNHHPALDDASKFGRGDVGNSLGLGHFGIVGSGRRGGQVPLSYLDDGALVSMFERFTVFNARAPRQQIRVLALDSEHAELEGSLALELPRHRVAVIRTPGFLESAEIA